MSALGLATVNELTVTHDQHRVPDCHRGSPFKAVNGTAARSPQHTGRSTSWGPRATRRDEEAAMTTVVDAPRTDRRRWFALAVIAMSQLTVVLDLTIVNVALPDAQRDLGISDENRQ